MTPTASARRALYAAAALILAACSDSSNPTGLRTTDESAEARGQQPDRIEAAFQRASPEVMGVPGTVFIDNDETIGKVVVGIEHMNAHGAVRAAMARSGVAEGDYEVVLTPAIHQMATLRDAFRPVVAGVQIHFTQYVCTLGFNVDHAGGRSFITNSHCTATQGGTEGTTYAQPNRTTHPEIIATEVDDPIYSRSLAGCAKGKKCRWSDASRALYSSGTASNRGEIAITTGVNTGSLTVAGVYNITSQDNTTTNYAVGTVVNKVGRTTGWTRGQVTRSCVNTGVSGSSIMQLCQTWVSDAGGATVVSGGDSGSGVWVDQGGGNVKLVGILWGGSSDNKTFIFSPLASIIRELGSVTATK